MSQLLPFPLLGLDSDNGSEFINHRLYAYCQRRGISFTRSRPYKKNDSAHVEQKNWSVVRRLVGYDRYSSKAALEQLERIYQLVRCYVNFFQPVMQLKHKSRHGAKVYKVYDSELSHNKSYPKEYRCIRNHVTRRWHDERQREGVC